MPLGGSLAFINVWALKDGDGWTLVDTGMQGPNAPPRPGARRFAGPLRRRAGRPRHRHPHASRPHRHGRLDHPQVRLPAVDHPAGIPDVPHAGRRHRPRGARGRPAVLSRRRLGRRTPRQLHHPLRRLRQGACTRCPTATGAWSTASDSTIGGRDWRVVVGSGHSPEHACLYCPELKLMISGDQVLPRISSNVSVFPTEPDGDPLDDWLTSLARIKTHRARRRAGAAGAQRSVPRPARPPRPADRRPRARRWSGLSALLGRAEAGDRRLRRAVQARRSARDVLGMATGESLAHLNCLLVRGRAEARPRRGRRRLVPRRPETEPRGADP